MDHVRIADKQLGTVGLDGDVTVEGGIAIEEAKQVADFHAGNAKVAQFFVGQVMKQTRGRAKPDVVNQFVQEELKATGVGNQ